MATQGEVYQALFEAGTQLKADLWSSQDKALLEQRAKDLVSLQVKCQTATDPQKKAEYKLAAQLVINHVSMLALTRMHVAQQHVAEALEKLFLDKLLPKLATLLIGLL